MLKAETIDKALSVVVFLLLVALPNQYSVRIFGAHVSLSDPLLLVGGMLCLLRAAVVREEAMLFPECARGKLFRRLTLLLPPVENLALLLLVALSFFKAENFGGAAKEMAQLTGYLWIMFVILRNVKLDGGILPALRTTLIVLCWIVVGVALVQYFDKGTDVLGVRGTFGNRNVYGGFLAVALPFVLACMLNARGMFERVACGLLLMVSLPTILSGAGLLGVLAGCGLVGAFGCRRVWVFLACAAIVLLLMLFILPVLPRDNPAVLMDSVAIYDNEGRVEPRYAEWHAALQLVKHEPRLGVGLGNYQENIGMHYGYVPLDEGAKEPDTHNLYLVFGSSAGLAGLFALALMFLLWFRRSVSAYFFAPDICGTVFALGALGAIAGFCIASVGTSLLVRGVFPVLVMVVGIAINATRRYSVNRFRVGAETLEDCPLLTPNERLPSRSIIEKIVAAGAGAGEGGR